MVAGGGGDDVRADASGVPARWPDAAGARGRSPREVGYRERLRTPWWWYFVALAVAAVLAAEFRVNGLGLTVWLPFGILLPLSLVMVWWLGHYSLEIRDGEISIRGAHLDLRYVSGVVGLDPRTLKLVVGREGDPAAFVSIRPWIGPGVQLWLDDEDDPTPYWIVSTRHPELVVGLLRAATP